MREIQIIDELAGIVTNAYKRKALALDKLKEMAEHDDSGVLAKALQQVAEIEAPGVAPSASASAASVQSSANPSADSEPAWVTSTPELPENTEPSAVHG